MKRTFQPNTRKKLKKHGFLARSAHVLKNRRAKGRLRLAAKIFQKKGHF